MTTPTINVNLKPCDCWKHREPGTHQPKCAAAPVNIPLPVERSFTCMVALGECDCDQRSQPLRAPFLTDHHDAHCPARPVKVSCSISGKTWDESRWEEMEVHSVRPLSVADQKRAYGMAAGRWALVKALVLGRNGEAVRTVAAGGGLDLEKVGPMFQQMHAVWAVLADMARAERVAHAAFLALPMDVRESSIIAKACGHVAADPEQDAAWPSRAILAHYFDRLLEQVGILGVAP